MKNSLEGTVEELGIKRILVVDDNPGNLKAAKEYFDSLAYLKLEYASNQKTTTTKN